MDLFTVAFHHATPHGVVTAVHIPDSPDPVPDAVLATLPDSEAAFARSLRGYRQVQFVGGRIALREACLAMGTRPGPLLADDRGAARLPTGLVGSVSHKRDMAIGMAARPTQGSLGVDLEDYGPPRMNIASKILTPEELAEIQDLPDGRKWIAVLLRFSIKESIYKAIDPFVRRYVGFQEAIVTPDLQGAATVQLRLTPPARPDGSPAPAEGPFIVDARYEWLYGRILTSVRIRRAG